MSSPDQGYVCKRPGSLLLLAEDVPGVAPGIYVLLSVGDTCTVSLAGNNEKDHACATSALFEFPFNDLCQFTDLFQDVNPL